eukprot:6185758-Pleurochrysis_carterae.AAC.1
MRMTIRARTQRGAQEALVGQAKRRQTGQLSPRAHALACVYTRSLSPTSDAALPDVRTTAKRVHAARAQAKSPSLHRKVSAQIERLGVACIPDGPRPGARVAPLRAG